VECVKWILGFFSAVEEVEHLLQAPTLGAVVARSESEGIPLGVLEAVVRGTTRQVDELEDLTLRPEPLKDVRVVGAGSSLGDHLDLFHGYIIPHLGQIASLEADLFSILSSYAPRTYDRFRGGGSCHFGRLTHLLVPLCRPIPAITAAIAVPIRGAAIEVDASPPTDSLVSLRGAIRHDPDIDVLCESAVVGGSEHATEVSGTSPLREIVNAAAVVLAVGESLHACIIPQGRGFVNPFLRIFW